MKAKLIHFTKSDSHAFLLGNERFYKLSEYINSGKDLMGNISVTAAFNRDFERIKQEYKDELRPYLTDSRGTNIVCISDSTIHIERLVFPAYPLKSHNTYAHSSYSIDGRYTMLIDGGDYDTIHDDEVYLRHLAMLNGLKYEGILTD